MPNRTGQVDDVVSVSSSGHRHLLTGSATLVLGAAIQAVTGAAFWLVAARTDATDDVGRATALFTSILFIAYLGGLGFQVSLARYAPARDRESHTVFTWGTVLAGAATALFGVGYLAVVDTEATAALGSWHGIAGPGLFVLAAAGAVLTLLVDVRWMTVRRWRLVVARIAVVGLLRFPLLLVPDGGHETVHLFAVAVLPLILTGIAGAVFMPTVTGARNRLFPIPTSWRAVSRFSAVNYVSTLTYQAPQFVLPVIVLLSVDPDANAAFYVAWGITSIAFYVPTAMGQALLAEGGKDGAELRGQVRVVVAGTTALMAAGAAVCFVARDVVTTVYGNDYAEAAEILPLLVAAGIPWAVTSVYLTEARILHRHLATVAITGSLTALILVPAAVLVPDRGVDGAAVAFLTGNLLAAAVAAISHRWGLRRLPDLVPGPSSADEDLAFHP